ncbi:multicopper oxidase [Rhodotorula paludigena]|uniref:multicopper oxidase n=1 Tax=Rhodotorula paludigena TaxID=86838 RepID=UPI00317848D0
MRAGLTAAAALALASSASAAVVEKWYNLTYVTASPDGFEKEWSVGVNGTWPPPILEVNYNDTVRVHALNSLDSPSSLHHHGIFFNGSNYYDGAPGVTQCGLPAGRELTYEIPVDRQWGTYWWHSHSGRHYQDGLRAPLIIHAPEEPHQYDEEIIIVISDWYHERATKLNHQFMNKYNPTGAEPIPDALLIYAAQNGSYYSADDKVLFNDNLEIPFEAGKTYRIRVLNTGIFSMLFFWIDGHDMRVIEADGVDTQEYPVDFLTLSVAQRYSVLVTARNDTSQNFKIHANFDSSMFDTVPEDLQLNYTATLSYGAGNPVAEEGVQDELGLMQDHLLVPVVVEEQFTPTTSLELDVWFDAYDNGVNRASMLNNISYVGPDTPSLMTMLSMGEDALNPVVYGPQTAQHLLTKNDVMDLMVINFDANAHPFHLHGHNFQVTRVATDVTSDDPELNPPHALGAANPMRRDTIIVPAGGAVNIAWRADNPGAWIFHCHIQWHMEAGLAVVFMEDIPGAQRTMTLPQQIKDQCDALGISTTGNAAGKMSVTDLSGAPNGPHDQAHITGWTPKAKGALAGCVLTALLGMITVVWYALGGQLDADELAEEVERDMAKKAAAGGGLLKRGFNAIRGKSA